MHLKNSDQADYILKEEKYYKNRKNGCRGLDILLVQHHDQVNYNHPIAN